MKFFSKKKNADDFDLIDESIIVNEPKTAPENPNVLTVEEVLGKHIHKPGNAKSTGALDSLKKRMLESAGQAAETEVQKTAFTPSDTKKETEKHANDGKKSESDKTLLEKCRPFILDEKGEDSSKNIPPTYKLESVADILKKDKKDTIDDFNQKYDFEADYLGRYVEKKLAEEKSPKAPPQKTEVKPENAPKYKTISTDSIPLSTIKNAQTNVSFTISDIDPIKADEKDDTAPDTNATVTFTPVTNFDNTQKIVVSSKTQQIDLTGEIAAVEDISSVSGRDVELEKSEFDDYVPQNEIKSEIDAKRFLRTFSVKKRNFFLITAISALFTVLIGIMEMPFMAGAVLANTKSTMIVCTVFLGLTVIANGDMLLSLKDILKKRGDADISAALMSIFVMCYAVVGIIKGEIVTDLCLTSAIILTVRAIGKFQKYSYLLSNLKQIRLKSQKKAVRLLSDPTVTFAMAKNSIEGDTLIAAPQMCDRIDDYLKHSTYGTFLGGRLPIITVISLLLSAFTFFATYKYFNSLFYGLFAAAAVQCFSALPTLFLIDSLPLYSASKKLNRKGAMIAGKAGAEHIELANAVVLNSDDLFPEGTVTLKSLKVLSENNMSDTILRAASLTKALSSPLFPIFKKIAGDEILNSLPVSDTVKYEERMGISGWVDNQLLFIGNRTIMEAHGISVPDIETDRKILRSGYFPVYVASNDTAVALLMVQYIVDHDVSRELRRLTQIGVTVLVNNSDPNLSNEMICDYLGLYDDSVMVMTTAGCNMYKNITPKVDGISAPAAYRGRPITLAKIINTANRIRRSNTALTVIYILTAVLGIIMFAYTSFTSSDALMDGLTVLLYSLASTLLSVLIYFIQKP